MTNIRVLSYAVNLFERLGKILPVHVIVGNHDIWAKKSNEITSIDSLKWIPNVQIYIDCQTYKWHDKKILLNHLKELYEKQFSWAAPYLVKTMVMYHYRQTIERMSQPEQKEQYLKEKIEQKKKEHDSLDIEEFLKD